MVITGLSKVFSVWYRNFERWDVSFFRQVYWHWEKEYIVPLGQILERKKIDVGTVEDITNIPIIEKISFGGIITITNIDERKGYKGRLFWAYKNDLIYSKIRVKQGSLAIVPDSITRLAVSTEYPVYSIKSNVDTKYLELVLRTKPFLTLLDGLAHGGSTKTRIPPEDFERLEIPLPPLDIQRAIVTRWQEGQSKVLEASRSLKKISEDLNEWLYSHYHTNTTIDVIKSRVMVVNWAELTGWDMKSARAAAFRSANQDFLPLSDFAEEATELVRTYNEPEKDWAVYGVNNREGVFLNQYQKGKDFNTAYKKIRKDWFFHNPTRSSVGSLGIVPEVPDNAVTSPEYQVWKIKQGLVPGYVAVLIGTPFFISLIQFHRVGAVKQRLYVENLLKIRIPVLSEPEQQKIADAREEALTKMEQARAFAKELEIEVEAMILGIKPVQSIGQG